MVSLGILYGLACATGQSVSYVFSRRFVLAHTGGPLRLFGLSHIIMGIISALALPLLWPENMPPPREYALPVAGMAGFYLIGQLSFFYVVRRVEASRASPLLGIKILVLAGISVIAGQSLSAPQWLAVGMGVAAALLLGSSGRLLPWRAVVAILFTCVTYCLSDLNIKATVDTVQALTHLSVLKAAMVSACVCYILCGAVSLVLLPWLPVRDAGAWLDACPFALSWLAAMVLFFACLGEVGPLYGNILQANRGLISILMGVVLARMGLFRIERKVTRAVLAQRLIAAALMVAAMALFLKD